MVLANSRFAEAVAGDLNAQVASCHVGARELIRIVERFGYERFKQCTERMFDHGEHVVREFIANLPDGSFRGTCHMDNNGLDDVPIKCDVIVKISGSEMCVDFSDAPDAQKGRMNCPYPSTVSAARVSLAMVAGGGHETPNEGHFRPLRVVTRRGSMFHPAGPQPCFLYGWPLMSAMEGIFEAISKAMGGRLRSGGAADIASLGFYGTRSDSGEPFFGTSAFPIGQGAMANADGATVFVAALAQSQTVSPELQEAKLPVLYEKWELTPDSGGPGKFRGGSGWEVHFRALNDMLLLSTIERTKVPGWAQDGGSPGTPNRFEINFADGHSESMMKCTDRKIPAGSRLRIYCGGGGYGQPSARSEAAVKSDLLDGIITAAHARTQYGYSG